MVSMEEDEKICPCVTAWCSKCKRVSTLVTSRGLYKTRSEHLAHMLVNRGFPEKFSRIKKTPLGAPGAHARYAARDRKVFLSEKNNDFECARPCNPPDYLIEKRGTHSQKTPKYEQQHALARGPRVGLQRRVRSQGGRRGDEGWTTGALRGRPAEAHARARRLPVRPARPGVHPEPPKEPAHAPALQGCSGALHSGAQLPQEGRLQAPGRPPVGQARPLQGRGGQRGRPNCHQPDTALRALRDAVPQGDCGGQSGTMSY